MLKVSKVNEPETNNNIAQSYNLNVGVQWHAIIIPMHKSNCCLGGFYSDNFQVNNCIIMGSAIHINYRVCVLAAKI